MTFTTTITETSKELNAYEKVKFKDTSNALKLDELTQERGTITIIPKGYVVLSIHNEKSDNPDYENYIIYDENGQKYVTGSTTFWNSFRSIWDEMSTYDGDWSLEVLRKPSKNFKGKDFLTCALV